MRTTSIPSIPCTHCGAPTAYAVTEAGTSILVDVVPAAGGVVRLDMISGVLRATLELRQPRPPGPLHKCHFATCEHYRHEGKKDPP